MKDKSLFNKITFLWMFGVLTSFASIQVGVRIQNYKLARLGSAGIISTVPFGAFVFLPTEKEIRKFSHRLKREKNIKN